MKLPDIRPRMQVFIKALDIITTSGHVQTADWGCVCDECLDFYKEVDVFYTHCWVTGEEL